jgi:hypothetical protein
MEVALKTLIVGTLSCSLILLCCLWAPSEARPLAADSTRAAASAHPALWVRAVQICEAAKDLVPGKVNEKMQELDKKGRVKSETNIDASISLDQAGKIRNDIVKASKDGKDVTAEEKKRSAEQEKKAAAKEAAKKAKEKDAKKDSKDDSDEHSYSFSLSDTPFNPERQNEVRVAETAGSETIDGASCISFEFSYPERREIGSKDKPATIRGKAWIDESSGRPMKLEYTSDPLPKHVKNMLTTIRYGTDVNGAWVLKQMAFDARGAFLFFGRTIRGDIRFSDYWKYIKPASEK